MNINQCPKCNKTFPLNSKYCDIDGVELVMVEYIYKGDYIEPTLGRRFLAYFLDGLVVVALSLPAFIVLSIILVNFFSGGGVNGSMILLLAFLFIIPLTYTLLKDSFGQGQSLGKRAVGVMVVHITDNKPCSASQSTLRNLVIVFFGFIPLVGWLIEPLMVMVSDNGERIGDKAANTRVIDVRSYNKSLRI
jgi:uncharacterized RDD family membrane protein YckC